MRFFLTMAAAITLAFACNSLPDAPDNPPPPNAPDLGPTVTQADPPPPISGGTLLASRDGKTVIAADADRDFVSFVDATSATERAHTALSSHDRPTRLAEDAGGRVHVVLRGTGEIATLSLDTGALISRRYACTEPRGIAYDPARDHVLVACASGELVTLPAASGNALSSVHVEADLRDVEVFGDRAILTTFRKAEVLQWSIPGGMLTARTKLPVTSYSAAGATPSLAWRMKKVTTAAAIPQSDAGGAGDGGAYFDPASTFVVSYQIDRLALGTIVTGYYGNLETSTAVLSAEDLSVAPGSNTGYGYTGDLGSMILPTDVVATSAGSFGVVAAGNVKTPNAFPFLWFDGTASNGGGTNVVAGQIVSVEMLPSGMLVLQSREPATLQFVDVTTTAQYQYTQTQPTVLSTVTLSTVSRKDTGHDIFHFNSGIGVACASCHGEGGDDSNVWQIDGTKPRRTASLKGTVKDTAPYHWDGELADLNALTHDVYAVRMGGARLASDQNAALKSWVESIPAPKPAPVDEAARVRGEALFQGKADCVRCHSGPAYTNNQTMDVGTGKAFQVPPLVGVSMRLPLMHDGCAATLEDRLSGACDTPGHGLASALTDAERKDLVVFLQSL